MLVLALDTSTEAVTVALAEVTEVRGQDVASGVEILAESTCVAANRHGELLAVTVDAVLADAGRPARALAAVVAGLGPGPFTGLRVGIVTVKAIADGLGIPAYGACSLDVVARRHRGGSAYAVLTDARRRQVYWASYDAAGRRSGPPAVAAPDDVAEALRGQVRRVCGAGALRYSDRFDGMDVVGRDPYPQARELVAEVAGPVTTGAPGDALTPLYLRRPDAVPPGPRKRVTPV